MSTPTTGKIRSIKKRNETSIKLNSAVSAINGMFHLMIDKSSKGEFIDVGLIEAMAAEAEKLLKICREGIGDAENRTPPPPTTPKRRPLTRKQILRRTKVIDGGAK